MYIIIMATKNLKPTKDIQRKKIKELKNSTKEIQQPQGQLSSEVETKDN